MAKGKKTLPKIDEQIYAHYLQVQSYAETGRKFDMPRQTVFGIVERLSEGRTELGQLRTSIRADMATKALKNVEDLIDLVHAGELGTEKSSRGLEAARAIGELSRLVSALEPKADAVPVGDTIINVHTGMRPPPELEQTEITPTTTTTYPKPS